MPKLIDIASIYGRSNEQIVKKLVANVFENEKRFNDEFKEVVD